MCPSNMNSNNLLMNNNNSKYINNDADISMTRIKPSEEESKPQMP